MGRRILVALGLCWLTATSVWSPFAHVHPGDPGHHHGNGFAHPHFAHAVHHDDHEDEGPELEEADHDPVAVWTEWTPTVPVRVEIIYDSVVVTTVAEPEFIPLGVAPQFTVRSHDPPARLRPPARSPPA